MNNNEPTTMYQMLLMFKDVFLGAIGGLVAYLLKYQKEKETNKDHTFSFISTIINMVLGGYVSFLFGSAIPEGWHYKDFIIGSVGVASYPILLYIESNLLDIILKKTQIKGHNETKK